LLFISSSVCPVSYLTYSSSLFTGSKKFSESNSPFRETGITYCTSRKPVQLGSTVYAAGRIGYPKGRIGYLLGRIGSSAHRIGYPKGRIGYLLGRIGSSAHRISYPKGRIGNPKGREANTDCRKITVQTG
jgi:hypothetical protein